jgi:hypothetical protein
MLLTPADQAEYEAIAAALRAVVASYPPALRALARPALDTLLAGEFSQIAALLPRWLADLAPAPAAAQRALGEAGLWLWWYAAALDDALDGNSPAALLAGQQALLRALAIYRGLGLADTLAWVDLEARALSSADAYARELGARAPDLAALDSAALDAWTPELLMDRAAPFAFSATAMLALAGVAQTDPRHADIAAALRLLAAARQVADDAGDWPDDLRDGRLNYVSAALIRRFLAANPSAGTTDLSLDRLAGYQLRDAPFWEELERTHAELCAAALHRLGPYGPCALAGLVRRQQASDGAHWERARTARAALLGLFGAGGNV